jgi:histone deacetylase 1/2
MNKLGSLPNNGVAHVCDACQQAKLHQLPYAASSRVSLSPLELVHTDVWGPAIKSADGFKYYVSFLDDFSKFSWVYLLKHKSDVENVFYQFQKQVELLLGTKIRSVQSDWGGEYQKLHTYFSQTGITHRISCPHTHQQNGAIERKQRHLVETALALLAQSSAPLRFWDDAVLTACYLINRMPSRVIQNTTPVTKLFKKPSITPTYAFSAARVGQTCGHTIPVNSVFALVSASSSDTALTIEASGV